MKRIASIFIALSLCTLPALAASPSITTICKSKAHRLDCNNNKITCTDGFVDGMTPEKAIIQLCNKNEQEVTDERDRKNTIKISVINDFCKLQSDNYTFTDACTQNKVTFGCKEYKIRDTVRIKNALKNYCNKNKTNEVIIQDSTTAKKAAQKAEQEKKKQDKENAELKQKNICESGGHGEWNDTLNKCNCNSGYVLDESPGTCVKETLASKNAKENLESLGTALTSALKKIKPAEQ